MPCTVEVLLKGTDEVVVQDVDLGERAPTAWADDDVRRLLERTLEVFDRVANPEAGRRPVTLRGFSWIVTPVDGGVAVALELATGAVVAGPFDADTETLTASITRVIARDRAPDVRH